MSISEMVPALGNTSYYRQHQFILSSLFSWMADLTFIGARAMWIGVTYIASEGIFVTNDNNTITYSGKWSFCALVITITA